MTTYRATLTRRRFWGLLPPFVLHGGDYPTEDAALLDLRCTYYLCTGRRLSLRNEGDQITIQQVQR